MFTTAHHNLPNIVSKQILKSLIGSLNATCIAYARGHLRFNARENTDKVAHGRGYRDFAQDDVPTIDSFNDAEAAIAEAKSNVEAATGFGFNTQMQAGELAGHLMVVRSYFVDLLKNMADTQNDVPLTIPETLEFQMKRSPDNNDELTEALALAVGIDPEMLKTAKLKMVTDDATDLRANVGKIITYLDALDGTHPEQDDVETILSLLPAHVEYKLMAAAIRAYDKASQRAMVQLLRGKLDGAGDIKMLDACKKSMQLELAQFSKQNRTALDEYIERGGALPELEDRTIVTEDKPRTREDRVIVESPATQAARHRQIEDRAEAERKATAPGPKARRVAKTN